MLVGVVCVPLPQALHHGFLERRQRELEEEEAARKAAAEFKVGAYGGIWLGACPLLQSRSASCACCCFRFQSHHVLGCAWIAHAKVVCSWCDAVTLLAPVAMADADVDAAGCRHGPCGQAAPTSRPPATTR